MQTNPNTNFLTMEEERREKPSGEIFSFPKSNPIKEQSSDSSEFEFGSMNGPLKSSPADDLFLNGRLLPHAFPAQLEPQALNIAIDGRNHSRKDSLRSSRSNSTNSRSSSCSGGRTSSSSSSFSDHHHQNIANPDQSKSMPYQQRKRKKPAAKIYRSNSQRWQFTVNPVLGGPTPVLKRESSRRKKNGEISVCEGKDSSRAKKQSSSSTKNGKKKTNNTTWFCLRILRWLLFVCRECHAMEPYRTDQDFLH